ncbi:MAG: glycosyltransferase family 4 protein, partial [Tissierellia bacterium]|nr:glycosyltransferase family 4 protein [Tissierellia bacterium]
SVHGIVEIIEFIKKFQRNLHLFIIGKPNNFCFQEYIRNSSCIDYYGEVNANTLSVIYKYMDFGIGAFKMESVDLSEACPLKTREYLENGLPVIVNYYDCAKDIDEIKAYVIDYDDSQEFIKTLIDYKYDKKILKALSRVYLSWDTLYREVFK